MTGPAAAVKRSLGHAVQVRETQVSAALLNMQDGTLWFRADRLLLRQARANGPVIGLSDEVCGFWLFPPGRGWG